MIEVLFIFIGIIIGYFIFFFSQRAQQKSYHALATTIIEQAELKAKQITVDAKEKAHNLLIQVDHDSKMKLLQVTRDVDLLKEQLQQKETKLLQERKLIEQKHITLQKEEKNIQKLKKKCEDELAMIAQMTNKDAEQYVLQRAEANLQTVCDTLIYKRISQAKSTANNEAKKIIQTSLARTASLVTSNSCIDLVTLPDNTFKGKIIGREGRNKKFFEDKAEVILVIDASSNTIGISSFDPEKRYIAKKTLEDLFACTKIHQESIQECLENRKKAFDHEAFFLGKEAALKARLTDLHPQILTLLGKLHFRLSLGQNVLQHAIEVASIMESFAAELQLDINRAKRMGLLHDIGKALPLTAGVSHAAAGASFLMQHGEDEWVCNGVYSHHNEIDAKTIEAALLKTADAISATRPGARDEKGISLLQRLQNMEQLAMQESGVCKAYAINAGHEIQVIVASKLTDLQSKQLAEKLSFRINQESTLPYPVAVSIINSP